MSINRQIPSYDDLFGAIDFRTGQDAKSVYSPAAYLADLLQLIDDTFKAPDIDGRRPDLKQILLNEENTFTLTPYLSIVNEILENRILEFEKASTNPTPAEDFVYENAIKENHFPLNLPFNLDFERVKIALSLLNVSHKELFEIMEDSSNEESKAIQYLGISPEMLSIVLEESLWTQAEVDEIFKVERTNGNMSVPLDTFLKVTGCRGAQVTDLLNGKFSTVSNPEENGLANTFLNQGNATIPQLSASETTIVAKEGGEIPLAWFNRLQQLLRLQVITELSFPDLQDILGRLCDHQLNLHAIQHLAVIHFLAKKYEQEIEEVTALFADISSAEIGDEEEPLDLFNRIFNGKFAELSGRYIEGNTALHPAFSEMDPLGCAGDILAPENRDFRERVQQALQISSKDIKVIVEAFLERAASQKVASIFDASIEVGALSVFFRISKLAEILDLDVAEILYLVEAIEKDPVIQAFNPFRILVDEAISEMDGFAILSEGDPHERIWLVQTLLMVGEWVAKADLTPEELRFIVSGDPLGTEGEEKEAAFRLAFSQSLHDNFLPVSFVVGQLQSDSITPRTARRFHEKMSTPGYQLLSAKDSRILTSDSARVDLALMSVMRELSEIRKDDFTGIGIESKVQAKIHKQLIFTGYLNAEQQLTTEYPDTVEKFRLYSDFSSHGEKIFSLIRAEIVQAVEALGASSVEVAGVDLEVSFFPSGLEGCGLTSIQQKEVYDTLIFAGYLSEEGEILDPGFFERDDFSDSFDLSAGMQAWNEPVYTFIHQRRQAFRDQKVAINGGVFESLNLSPVEQSALLENLRFNGYLDDANQFIDKDAILNLSDAQFLLALQFIRYKRKILALLKNKIEVLSIASITFREDALLEVASLISGHRIVDALNGSSLEKGILIEEKRIFFGQQSNLTAFSLGLGFSSTESSIVFSRLGSIVGEINPFFFSPDKTEALEFTVEEFAELMTFLVYEKWLDGAGMIPVDKVPYFLETANVLSYELEGYEDFQQELFFILQDIAKAVNEVQLSLADSLQSAEVAQKESIFNSFVEVLETEEGTGKALLDHVFSHLRHISESIMAPIFEAADPQGKIAEAPSAFEVNDGLTNLEQLALLVNKFGLDLAETEMLLYDQSLIEKLPEPLLLPIEVEKIDAVLSGVDEYLYVFSDHSLYKYLGESLAFVEGPVGFETLSPILANLSQVNAAFVDPSETAWILAGDQYFKKGPDQDNWEKAERRWGELDSNFSDLERVDAAFSDNEGKSYLFAGDQYIRMSGSQMVADEGYPRHIREYWKNEIHEISLPEHFLEGISASIQLPQGEVLLINGQEMVTSDEPGLLKETKDQLGKVENHFDRLGKFDASITNQDHLLFFSGNQVIRYSHGTSPAKAYGDEGSLMQIEDKIPGLPHEFQDKIDAAFWGSDEITRLFSGQYGIDLGVDLSPTGNKYQLSEVWGKVRNNLRETGLVDAAFSGLDGRAYLFSGDQFYRYSGSTFTKVDEGYPKTISAYWGGLDSIDAAFVLNGATYLFGHKFIFDSQGTPIGEDSVFVKYSTSDYEIPDEGYPQAQVENFWNLPFALLEQGFDTPDCVFVGADQQLYLFLDDRFVTSDLSHNHRWWSEPKGIQEHWDSLTLQAVAAGFTDKKGRTYLFSKEQEEGMEGVFVRFSDTTYQKQDDRFPKVTRNHWGIVYNTIERNEKIDGAVTLLSKVPVEEESEEVELVRHTYLFSDTQFFRYTEGNYSANRDFFVDEGYPKTIQSALREEPRFANLPEGSWSTIDDVFVDRRHVYLVSDGKMYRGGEEVFVKYEEDTAFHNVGAATMENGIPYFHDGNAWHRVTHPEVQAPGVVLADDLPPSLRRVPEEFQHGVNAILHGTNKAMFVFKGTECYDDSTQISYPIAESWGKINNLIQNENQIDAGLIGRDDKLYLFAGNQVVTYSPQEDTPEIIPDFTDSHPQLISELFFGLDNVAVAYVEGDKTYLIEAADETGTFRYVCFSGSDYGKPDSETPQSADFSFWGIPSIYVENGFDRIDAVLVDEDNRYLFMGQEFVQYHFEDDMWTYPREIELIWRGLSFNDHGFESIRTVFEGPADELYFVGQDSFRRHENQIAGNITEVSSRWGIVENRIFLDGTIDAAFVHEKSKQTFLFSGDQYVRYSTDKYEFVDEGYPKLIAESIREEAAFANLPQAPELDLEELANLGIRAIIEDQESVFIFDGNHMMAVSTEVNSVSSLDGLCKLRNEFAQGRAIDAAVMEGDKIYFFAGDQVIRYTERIGKYVDHGYPRSILAVLDSEFGMLNVPDHFTYDLDAVSLYQDIIDGEAVSAGPLTLFKGEEYFQSGFSGPVAITEVFGIASNLFVGTEAQPNVPLDTAFIAPDGRLYLFKDNQYLRYTDPLSEVADEGYPKVIKDNWGDLPPFMENGLKAAFVLGERTYLVWEDELKAEEVSEGSNREVSPAQYVRYTDKTFSRIDKTYPQTFNRKWTGWNGILLSDLRNISIFRNLQDKYQGGESTLIDFLHNAPGYNMSPYELLSSIFEFEQEDIQWLKRNNAFLLSENQSEAVFDLELVIRIHEIVSLATKMGTFPQDLYESVLEEYSKDTGADYGKIADRLVMYLGLLNSDSDFDTIQRQIRDELNTLKRDALVPYLSLLINQDRDAQLASGSLDPAQRRILEKEGAVESSRDLYARLLIDVEMESCGESSFIVEAISAVQLYFHRFFVNLETIDDSFSIDKVTRANLKERWKWLRNYRVWEANRKVFLYPENYIRPELRDTKTPAFKTLEEDLMQGELTEYNVEKAFKKYLDEFTEVSRLAIAGGYVFDDPNNNTDKKLVLFGRTKTDPDRYYYRFASFKNGETNAATYEPWLPAQIQIETKRVYPVFAFERTFVFWAKVEQSVITNDEDSASATESGNTTTVKNNGKKIYSLKIYFSFLNLNNEWIQPQYLDARADGNNEELNIVEESEITEFSLFVENSSNIEGNPHENIVINCTYKKRQSSGSSTIVDESRSFHFTPEFVVKRALKADFAGAGKDVFKSLFGEGEEIADASIVLLNTYESSSEGPWFSFDHKGGSFLCKPTESTLGRGRVLSELAGNADGFPIQNRIDAAFYHGNDHTYFFNNDDGTFDLTTKLINEDGVDAVEETIHTVDDIINRWGKIPNNIALTGIVDAAWNDGTKRYLFSGNEVMKYSGNDRIAERGYPRLISQAGDGIPNVSSMNAVLEGLDGQTYFFSGSEFFEQNNSTGASIDSKWGKASNPFQSVFSFVSAAFVDGNHTYLIGADEYVRYTGANYETFDVGYPKANSLENVLTDLGCINLDEFENGSSKIFAAYDLNGEIFFDESFKFSDKKISVFSGDSGLFAAYSRESVLYKFFQGRFTISNEEEGRSTSRSINAAFLGVDGNIYLFSQSQGIKVSGAALNGDQLRAIVDDFEDPVTIDATWANQPPTNKIITDNRVDAAFTIGDKTYLVSGDEYIRYTGPDYEFIDEGYPKKLATNTEGLPTSMSMDAALRITDNEIYFFSGQSHLRSTQLSTLLNNSSTWGLVHNNIIDSQSVHAAYVVTEENVPINDSDIATVHRLSLISGNEYYAYTSMEGSQPGTFIDEGYPKAISFPQQEFFSAAFVRRGNVYFVSPNSYIVCDEDDPFTPKQGYPKSGRLGDLVKDVWDQENRADDVPLPTALNSSIAGLPVHGAYVAGDELFVHSHGYTMAIHLLTGVTRTLNNSAEYFEAAYLNNANQVVKLKNESYSAAVNIKGELFLFIGDEFSVLNSVPDSFPDPGVFSPDSRKVSDVWGISTVDAAFTLDNRLYLFAQDKYYSFDPLQEPLDLRNYQFLGGNWANIPKEMVLGIDAALRRENQLFFFKNEEYMKYSLGAVGKPQPYEISNSKFDIIRLTAGTGADLNQILLSGGMDGLLSLETQQIDETPGFTVDQQPTSKLIQVNQDKVEFRPVDSHLDFDSPNGIYYHEIFFHAPFLLAQTLNNDQKFEDAKRWYEYIYDPTEGQDYWKFLPFLSADIQGLLDGFEGVLADLQEIGVDVSPVSFEMDRVSLLPKLEAVKSAFIGSEVLEIPVDDVDPDPNVESKWEGLESLQTLADLFIIVSELRSPNADSDEAFARFQNELIELIFVVERLATDYRFMLNHRGQINTYLDDPFDPHSIASFRKIAYRKTIIMRYVDNLLDWGDLLFTQYTVESINEARMLYILAYDLLGRKPEGLGTRPVTDDKPYRVSDGNAVEGIFDIDPDYDFLLYLESGVEVVSELSFAGTVHDSIIATPYFHVPENELFIQYWDRAEDRLHKIRHCLNILGIKQPLPLFQPPIDPNALVSAAAGGGGFGGALAGSNVTVPHYRYTFLTQKAQGLVQKVSQFGGELLASIEKKDAEALSILQNTHEKEMLVLNKKVREAQWEEAKLNTLSLKESKANASIRTAEYKRLIGAGMNAGETVQASMMGTAVALHTVSAIMKGISAVAHLVPNSKLGVFILGVDFGGPNVGEFMDKFGEAIQSGAEGLSMAGELAGILAGFERTKEDWELQKKLAESDEKQIEYQIKGSLIQEQVAKLEISNIEKEIDQNESIATFMKEKFTNQQLYQWIIGRLSAVYYQTYKLALDMGKSAERAMVFERGMKELPVPFIRGGYWDSRRKGLMAGEGLGLDLDRLDQSFIETDERSFEITKKVSLLELDPLAYVRLILEGSCEFSLTESLYDYDFPGHYRRQIKTISVSFGVEEGVFINATLTQLNNRVILDPDVKAVKYLLDPKDQPPVSIRTNWKAHQQIALSHVDEFEPNNGMFELRFDSERYLPFEGTGAVSNWRLELNGKRGSFNPKEITDVVVTVKYSARQGGEAFANAVKGMLKPYIAAHYLDVTAEFPNEWDEFISGDGDELSLPVTRELFPHIASSKIPAIMTQISQNGEGSLRFVLNDEEEMTLSNGKATETSGLKIASRGSTWNLRLKGNKELLDNLSLVVMYKAKVV